MKLNRLSEPKRRLQAREALSFESTQPGLDFDIRRDVTKKDWDFIRNMVDHNIEHQTLIRQTIQLLILGSENKTGLDMSKLQRRAGEVALNKLKAAALGAKKTGVGFIFSELLVECLVLKPEDRKYIRQQVLDSEIEESLWQSVVRQRPAHELEDTLACAVALFFLVPEERDRLQSLLRPKEFLEEWHRRFLKRQATGRLTEFLPLLFPGDYSEMIPADYPMRTKEGILWLFKIVELYVLTHGEMTVTPDGKFRVTKPTQPLTTPRILPERDTM